MHYSANICCNPLGNNIINKLYDLCITYLFKVYHQTHLSLPYSFLLQNKDFLCYLNIIVLRSRIKHIFYHISHRINLKGFYSLLVVFQRFVQAKFIVFIIMYFFFWGISYVSDFRVYSEKFKFNCCKFVRFGTSLLSLYRHKHLVANIDFIKFRNLCI